MAGRGASLNSSDAGPATVFVVKKPDSDSSLEIRDAILRDYFAFTEEDIKEFKRLKSDKFFYIHSKGVKEWANKKEVKSWADAGGNVSITVPQSSIDEINKFREERASFEIFKVGMFIADADTRKSVVEFLESILSSSGEKRISALNNLMITIAASPLKNQIFQALRFLSNESGYKNNPFLLIAMARTTVYTSDTPSIGSNEVNQSAIAAAVKAANENLYNGASKTALTKITKTEAAAINFWASDLYSQSNAEDKANQRRWVRRFLTVTDAERAGYNEGDPIEIIPPGTAEVRNATPLERDLQRLNTGMSDKRKEWEMLDRGRQVVETTDPRSADRTEITMNERFNVQEKVWNRKDGNKPAEQSRPQTYNQQVEVNSKMNPGAVRSVNAWGGGADLILKALNAKIFMDRMAAITTYLSEKDALQRKIKNERQYLVPPKPETIKKMLRDFESNGRLTADPHMKARVVATLEQLNRLAEESNAFWGK